MRIVGKRFKRNERRHQRNRKQAKRIVERRQKWFHLTEGGHKGRSTPVCLDPEYVEIAGVDAFSGHGDV